MKMTWREINKHLNTFTEEQLIALLAEERAGRRRASILQRLHQRYAVLRTARERLELLQLAARP
jgi:hypothetical protein